MTDQLQVLRTRLQRLQDALHSTLSYPPSLTEEWPVWMEHCAAITGHLENLQKDLQHLGQISTAALLQPVSPASGRPEEDIPTVLLRTRPSPEVEEYLTGTRNDRYGGGNLRSLVDRLQERKDAYDRILHLIAAKRATGGGGVLADAECKRALEQAVRLIYSK